MNRRGRTLVAAAGVVGLAAALVVVATPEAGGAVGASSLVAAAGNDYVLAAAVAAVALAVAVVALGGRSVGGIDQATPPDPETVAGAPHPGVEFDRAVDGASLLPFGGDADRRAAVRDRVRRAVVRSVMHREGISRDEARARVDSGAWTDDRAAAAFLSDSARVPFARRVGAFLAGESRFERRANRAVDELCRRDGVEEAER